MRQIPPRTLISLALAALLLAASCSGTRDESPAAGEPADSEATTSDHHAHGALREIPPGVAVPAVDLEAAPDPVSGWNLRVRTTNFVFAPERASQGHVDGEGHAHLYVDGVKVARIYGEWHHIDPLPDGEHELRVELSSNDHSTLAVGTDIVDATVVVIEDTQAADTSSMSDDEGSMASHDDGDASPHHADGGGHGGSEASTPYDADVADAAQTISVEVAGGAPAGGARRVEVERGSVVALLVTSDAAEEVHVHGYDILQAVSAERPAHFAFTAEIAGVFEVELEGSGVLLLQLEIS